VSLIMWDTVGSAGWSAEEAVRQIDLAMDSLSGIGSRAGD
jgi:hypothetical protein